MSIWMARGVNSNLLSEIAPLTGISTCAVSLQKIQIGSSSVISAFMAKTNKINRKKWSKHSEIFYNIQSMLYTGLSPHKGHVTKIRWPSQTKWKQRVVKIFHISLLAMISYNNPAWYKGMWIIFQCELSGIKCPVALLPASRLWFSTWLHG